MIIFWKPSDLLCHIHTHTHTYTYVTLIYIYMSHSYLYIQTHTYPIYKVWQLWLKNASLEYIAQLNERQKFKFRSSISFVNTAKQIKNCVFWNKVYFLIPKVRYTILDEFQQLNTDTWLKRKNQSKVSVWL